MSEIDLRTLLTTVAFRPGDVEALLDPGTPTYSVFDPDMGYVPGDVVLHDGMDHSYATYRYEPGGQRKVINYADRPCRINTYGDSFTHCQQGSDGETWQEVLAAHIGEPIRNFGMGGYGVYQAYSRARMKEATELSAENVILNIWGDDHLRNVDACRWLRTAWGDRNRPKEQRWPLHGLPWPHVRYNAESGAWVEHRAHCKNEDDMRALTDPEHFYEVFKDDEIAHLFVLMQGGDAPSDKLQAIADALGIDVDLGKGEGRVEQAQKFHLEYGYKSTDFVLSLMHDWTRREGKKLLVLLSYGGWQIREFIASGYHPHQPTVDYLDAAGIPYVDHLPIAAEDYKSFSITPKEYMDRFYIGAAGAAVFGHFSAIGNHWYAFGIKNGLVDFLDPKPAAYA